MNDWIGARCRLPGSALHLAIIRIVFAMHALTVLTSPSLPLIRRLSDEPLLSTHTMLPPALEQLVIRRLDLIIAVGVIAAVFVIVGLATRTASWILLAVFLSTQNYFFRFSLFHDDWLYFNFYLLVLCLSRSADRLALDALIRPRPAAASPAYRWPVEVMIGWFSLVYISAGIAKLMPLRKGVLWLGGSSLQHFAVHFYFDSPIYWLLGHPLFDYSTRWPFCVGAVATVLIELSAGLLLVTRTADAWIVGAIILLHVGVALLGIPGFVQISILSSLLFLRPRSSVTAASSGSSGHTARSPIRRSARRGA